MRVKVLAIIHVSFVEDQLWGKIGMQDEKEHGRYNIMVFLTLLFTYLQPGSVQKKRRA